jgi:hypothetical protein
MTFSEFLKATSTYQYKNSYGMSYQEIYIGLKSNENFMYFMQELKEMRSKSLHERKINEEGKYSKYLQDASVYFINQGGKSFLNIADQKKKAHHTIIEQALAEGKPVPPAVLADYPELQPETRNTKPETQNPKPETQSEHFNTTEAHAFCTDILNQFNDQGKVTKSAINQTAAKYFTVVPNGRILRELIEVVQIQRAKGIVRLNIKDVYNELFRWYEQMPTYHYRDSNTSIMQQFSTPIYIGYVMGLYCLNGADKAKKTVFEPSAGNGLLLSAFNIQNCTVNELDRVRTDILKWQKFPAITNQDAALPFVDYKKKFDCVVSNPPFYHQNENSKNVYYDGKKISTLDQVCVLRALDTMKDNGRAAFLIDGHPGNRLYSHAYWDDKGQLISPHRNFFEYLYANYFVEDILHVNGHKLYSRQGQATNLRIVLIAGRRAKPDIDQLPPLYDPAPDQLIDTPEELYHRIMNPQNRQRKAKRSDEADLMGKLHTAHRAGNTVEFNEIAALLLHYGYKVQVKKGKVEITKAAANTARSNIIENEVKYFYQLLNL